MKNQKPLPNILHCYDGDDDDVSSYRGVYDVYVVHVSNVFLVYE